MQGVGRTDVLLFLYFKCPTTKQMRCLRTHSCGPFSHRRKRKHRHPLRPVVLRLHLLDDSESDRLVVGRLALAL